jgi:hypothetical protein
MKRSLLGRLSRRPVIVATAVLLLGASAFAIARWLAPPSPLTNEDIKAVTAAVNKIRPGFDVANLRRDSDGMVRAFVSDGRLGGETIALEKSDGQWIARVETEFF